MDLKKLFDAQRELDAHINEQHPPEPGEDRLAKRILALMVELGECCQEWRGFKFWSHDQEPHPTTQTSCMDDVAERLWCGTCHINFSPKDQFEKYVDEIGRSHSICPTCKNNILLGFRTINPILEEFVDCLHFILSIGLELDFTNVEYLDVPEPKDESITEMFNAMFWHVSCLDHTRDLGRYTAIFTVFIDIGEMLGFTWEQIESAYFEKLKINHARQDTNY